MADIKEALTDKVGPVPVWAWGGIVGIVAIVLMYVHNNSSATMDATTSDTTATDSTAGDLGTDTDYGDAALDTTGNDSSSVNSNGSIAGDIGTTNNGNSSFRKNAQWLRAGVTYATAQNNNPLVVAGALNAYLDGQALSQKQAAIVNLVIDKYGLPPQIPDVVSTVKNPTKAGGTTVTAGAPKAGETGDAGGKSTVSAGPANPTGSGKTSGGGGSGSFAPVHRKHKTVGEPKPGSHAVHRATGPTRKTQVS